MNVDKSIQRLSWRFGNGQFTPNQNDVDSLNGLIEWINDQRKITLNENLLFAKLFIYVYHQNLKHFRATVFDKEPQKDLARILSASIEIHYKTFTERLNDLHREEIFTKNGINLDHNILSDDDKLKIKNMKDDLQNVWEVDEVSDELNLMINNALNKFQ